MFVVAGGSQFFVCFQLVGGDSGGGGARGGGIWVVIALLDLVGSAGDDGSCGI